MKAVLLGLAVSLAFTVAWSKDRTEYPDGVDIGIEAMTVPPGLEDVYGTPARPGALITRPDLVNAVEPYRHPKGGDYVIAVDGQQVWSAEHFFRLLDASRPDGTANITLIRKGKEITLKERMKRAETAIYLPAQVCALPTTGTIAGENAVPFLFFGVQVTAKGALELGGQCPLVIEPCSRMRLVKQTEDRTIVTMNGRSFAIRGNWTEHTHVQETGCQEELGELARLSEIRRQDQERSHATTSEATNR
jgi:hypothetical protein